MRITECQDVAHSIGGVMSKDTKPPWSAFILAGMIMVIIIVIAIKGAYIQLSMNGVGM